jgi:hypothetical protein
VNRAKLYNADGEAAAISELLEMLRDLASPARTAMTRS